MGALRTSIFLLLLQYTLRQNKHWTEINLGLQSLITEVQKCTSIMPDTAQSSDYLKAIDMIFPAISSICRKWFLLN